MLHLSLAVTLTIFDRSNIHQLGRRGGGGAGGRDPTPFFITQEQRASRKMYFLMTHVTVRELHSVMVEVVNCYPARAARAR